MIQLLRGPRQAHSFDVVLHLTLAPPGTAFMENQNRAGLLVPPPSYRDALLQGEITKNRNQSLDTEFVAFRIEHDNTILTELFKLVDPCSTD